MYGEGADMGRKNLDYLIIAAMFFSGLLVTISGLVTDLLGLHQFALHRRAGYVCAGLVVLHLALKWSRVVAYLKRLRHPARQEQPARRVAVLGERGLLASRRQLLVSALAAAGGYVLGRLIPAQRPVELAFPEQATDIGELYHQWSKPGRSWTWETGTDWGRQSERTKSYADAERIALPSPQGYRGPSLEEVVEARRSIRDYSAQSLSLEGLSLLLHAAQGITEQRWGFRAAPSAGALYPIELYAVVHNVTGLEPGIYHYAVQGHELELLQMGNFRAAVTRAGLWQDFLGEANVCFVLSAIFQRTRWKYRERTYRYVLLEAGHIGQNLYLEATSMGLGACAVGAFLDDKLNDLLELDGKEEAVLYLISVGGV
jgi:SagB-type dehydrogenase family enzyme